MCRGFASVDVPPSPKLHSHVPPPDRDPLNEYVDGLFCTAYASAAGTGDAGPPWYTTRISFWFGCRLKKPPP